MTNLYYDKFKQKEDDMYAKRAKEDAVYNKQAILEKAIKKVIEGGWHEAHDFTVLDGHIYDLDKQRTDDLIYWPPFAKALWGAPKMLEMDLSQPSFETRDGLSEWQYHLQRMIISPDPIKYLGENID